MIYRRRRIVKEMFDIFFAACYIYSVGKESAEVFVSSLTAGRGRFFH